MSISCDLQDIRLTLLLVDAGAKQLALKATRFGHWSITTVIVMMPIRGIHA